jgi:hypothetical protein
VKNGGEARGVRYGVSTVRSKSLKLLLLDSFALLLSPLDLPSSDSKSSFVSSTIVKRNLGGPERLCSLMSSVSTLSSLKGLSNKSLLVLILS